ncbi:glycosyl transferase, partial [Tuber borchii]
KCAITPTTFKLLLFPLYMSTDFAVHRNWLTITHLLSVKEWCYEEWAFWTLDYLPFLAAFECILSQFAQCFSAMLDMRNLGYDSVRTVYFQRQSVM